MKMTRAVSGRFGLSTVLGEPPRSKLGRPLFKLALLSVAFLLSLLRLLLTSCVSCGRCRQLAAGIEGQLRHQSWDRSFQIAICL